MHAKPAAPSAIIGSVPLEEAGIASGTNSTLRELGGVLGVAVLASVFTRHVVYGSQHAFIAGFTQALWVAVAFSGLGVLAGSAQRRPALGARRGDDPPRRPGTRTPRRVTPDAPAACACAPMAVVGVRGNHDRLACTAVVPGDWVTRRASACVRRAAGLARA
jgi:hypothetical protein